MNKRDEKKEKEREGEKRRFTLLISNKCLTLLNSVFTNNLIAQFSRSRGDIVCVYGMKHLPA
jgi:hypothetical protein